MPTLFHWNLTVRYGVPLGIGIVSGHPKLAEGMKIHTSPILHAVRMENRMQLETASGRVYHLLMKEWRPSSEKNEAPALKLLGLPSDFGARCVQIREDAFRIEKSYLWPFIKPGALFLRIVGPHILSVLWRGADSRIRDASIKIHPGMFQDSYLVQSAYQESSTLCCADLRLFPIEDRLEPYHISQEIKLLLVSNEGRTDIAFSFSSKNILCPSGTITSILIQDSAEFILEGEVRMKYKS